MTNVSSEGLTNFGGDTLSRRPFTKPPVFGSPPPTEAIINLGTYHGMSSEYYAMLYASEVAGVFTATDHETDKFIEMLAADLYEVQASDAARENPAVLITQAKSFYKKANDAINGSIATKIFMRARVAELFKQSIVDHDNTDLDVSEVDRRERIMKILYDLSVPSVERFVVAETVEAYALEIETPIVENVEMTRTEELEAIAAGVPRIATLASKAIDLVRTPLGAIAQFLEAPVDEEAEIRRELARVL